MQEKMLKLGNEKAELQIKYNLIEEKNKILTQTNILN